MKRLLVALFLLFATPALAVFNGQEQKLFTNISANTASFDLRGGQYGVDVHATFGAGSVTLQKLANDGSSWVTCLTAFSTDGYATVNLPGGHYRFAIATATAVYVNITAIVTVQ
jgi:hypothetical protein